VAKFNYVEIYVNRKSFENWDTE